MPVEEAKMPHGDMAESGHRPRVLAGVLDGGSCREDVGFTVGPSQCCAWGQAGGGGRLVFLAPGAAGDRAVCG